jgi:TorA maturation chaperone TorD
MENTQDESLTTDQNQVERLIGQSLMLGLLSMILYRYPDHDLLETIIGDELFSEIPFAGDHPDVISGAELVRTWLNENRRHDKEEMLEDLQMDYNPLFIGPGKVLAPPYESVHFSSARLMFQEETLQVREWYARFGLQSEKIYNEPDDHIGLELLFMAHLASQAASAAKQGELDIMKRMVKAQREFASKHLFRWGFRWCDQVCEHARTAFFHGTALLTRGALLEMAKMLEVDVDP